MLLSCEVKTNELLIDNLPKRELSVLEGYCLWYIFTIKSYNVIMSKN